jgi:hypothetical protein
MQSSDWVILYGLRAIAQHEPATAGVIQAALRQMATMSGLIPSEKVDEVLVNALLKQLSAVEPPLATATYPPGGTDHLGRARPGVQQAWELTEAGDLETRRLERQAGLI